MHTLIIKNISLFYTYLYRYNFQELKEYCSKFMKKEELDYNDS